MYLRWRVWRRPYRDGRRGHWDRYAAAFRQEVVTRTAVLVTSARVAGQPRQRYVAWLGSLDMIWVDPTSGAKPYHRSETEAQRYGRVAAERRIQFWRHVRFTLGRALVAGTIAPARCRQVAGQIAAVIPVPTAADLAAVNPDFTQWWKQDDLSNPAIAATAAAIEEDGQD